MNRLILTFSFLILLLSAACEKPSEPEEERAASNRFAQDSLLRKLYEAQDRRDTQSLLRFIGHKETKLRAAAAEAFASVQDSTAVKELKTLLGDPEKEVRTAAAYALGQFRNPALAPVLWQHFNKETDQAVKKYLLEALGKCADEERLGAVAELSPEMPPLVYGQALCIFRASLEGVFTKAATEKMSLLLAPGSPDRVRVLASCFFARHADKLSLKKEDAERFHQVARNDNKAAVSVFAFRAAGLLPEYLQAETLTAAAADTSRDYRSRTAALRAMQALPYDSADQYYSAVSETVKECLNDRSVHVQLAAASFWQKNPLASEKEMYLELGEKHPEPRTAAALLAAAVRLEVNKKADDKSKNLGSEACLKQYGSYRDNYKKGFFLEALAENPINFFFLFNELKKKKDNTVLSTYIMNALCKIRRHEALETGKNEQLNKNMRKQFIEIFRYGIESGNVGLISLAASEIRNPEYDYKSAFSDTEFLKKAAAGLSLPRDTEALIELRKTIAYFEDREFVKPAAEYNNPINWARIDTLDRRPEVLVFTNKGRFTLTMFADEAPASVDCIMHLAEEDFYKQKTFHRVISNFVAQGGCPRGDGYGSTHYTLRSEFAPLYYESEGLVGLASAGADTESCQFFFTHLPTPHLDGRYTIIGKVSKGIEVVNKLQVGDRILEIRKRKDGE